MRRLARPGRRPSPHSENSPPRRFPCLPRLAEKDKEAAGSSRRHFARFSSLELTTDALPVSNDKLLHDQDTSVRIAAINALNLDDPANDPKIAELLNDKDAEIRMNAALTLAFANRRPKSLMPLLGKLLSDS